MSDIGEDAQNTPKPEIDPAVVEANLNPDVSEFPVPVRAFTNTLVKTEDEIWVKLLQLDCKGQVHTPTEWREILAATKQREV